MNNYYMPMPDLTIYTPAQIADLKAAVLAERMRRLTGGTVTSGGKNQKNFTVQTATESELASLERAIARIESGGRNSIRRMDFSRRCG